MYIQKFEMQNLTNKNSGFAVVSLDTKEIVVLDNMIHRLSKTEKFSSSERGLNRDFSVLHSLILHGSLLDSEIDNLHKGTDVNSQDAMSI